TVFSFAAPQVMADTYRYAHVTIDTPWLIFLVLTVAVLLPFILMAVLYWHNALRKNREEECQARIEGEGQE
ncbi:hypothetical protein ACFL2V_15575, partial [Pseudomonadota bacterium]